MGTGQRTRRITRIFSVLAVSAGLTAARCADPEEAAGLDEIVRRATDSLQSDWNAYPGFAYIERDETRKGGKSSSRTSQVLTIADSDYYMPVAIDDTPLSAKQRRIEIRILRGEVDRRNRETPAAREQRLANFRKQRDENAALVLEFPKSFLYTLAGEEEKNGHPAYVLSAAPRKRTGPLSRAGKVLSGMNGTIWVDRSGFHVIRAECRVINAVPMFGILARVLPGTHVELELQPVNESAWLISRYSLTLTVSKLWFKSTQVTESTYWDFRPNRTVLEALLSGAE